MLVARCTLSSYSGLLLRRLQSTPGNISSHITLRFEICQLLKKIAFGFFFTSKIYLKILNRQEIFYSLKLEPFLSILLI
ncbi:hypothetical protein T03_10696 [Trichinella britovi]|uniref:Uncharacterized protein n=1 Tax=Trichinella britovi TaxID=45882 RepID=A0A0V1CG60_TRIBR|nr:hypothetical protein T03_10696 [Trichinella britovi]